MAGRVSGGLRDGPGAPRGAAAAFQKRLPLPLPDTRRQIPKSPLMTKRNAFWSANPRLSLVFRNCIRELCDPLSLPEIKLLDVSKNGVERVSAEFLRGCPKLETLNLSANKISECGGVWVTICGGGKSMKSQNEAAIWLLLLLSRLPVASALQTHRTEAGEQPLHRGSRRDTGPPKVSRFRSDGAGRNPLLEWPRPHADSPLCPV